MGDCTSTPKDQKKVPGGTVSISVTFPKDDKELLEAVTPRKRAMVEEQSEEKRESISWDRGITARRNPGPCGPFEDCPVRDGAVRTRSVVDVASTALKIHLRRACGIAWQTKRSVICWVDLDPLEIIRHEEAIDRRSPVMLASGGTATISWRFKELHGKQYVLDAACNHFQMQHHAFWDGTGIAFKDQDPGIGRMVKYLEIDPIATLLPSRRWKVFNYLDPHFKGKMLPYHDQVIADIIKHVFPEDQARKLFDHLYEEETEASDDDEATDSESRVPEDLTEERVVPCVKPTAETAIADDGTLTTDV